MAQPVTRMAKALIARLAIPATEGDALPAEFRLFVAGPNVTANGTYLFDEKAAQLVMAAYAAHGVDKMIDLEHLSLDDQAPNYDPDARGWFKLELRDDGSLWAVDVRWTDDGASRLTEKRQRYISPAFAYDKQGRVTEIVNVAITALPATHGTPALVAASVRGGPRDLRKLSAGISFSDLMTLLRRAIAERNGVKPNDDWSRIYVMDVFEGSVVYELDSKLYEVAYSVAGASVTLGAAPIEVIRSYTPVVTSSPAGQAAARVARLAAAGGTGMTPEQLIALGEALGLGPKATVEEILAAVGAMMAKIKAAHDGAPAPDGKDAPAAEPAAPEMAAAKSRLILLTAKASLGDALREVERWRESHTRREEELAKLAAERATLEASERRSLVAELVKCGEPPATAWANDEATVAAEPWASMSMEALRARVAKMSGRKPFGDPPPVPPARNAAGLTEDELRICKELGADPADYVRLRDARASR